MLNSSRKPFSDLTNKLSAVSISSTDDIKPGKVKAKRTASSSNELPAVSLSTEDIKPGSKVQGSFSFNKKLPAGSLSSPDDIKPVKAKKSSSSNKLAAGSLNSTDHGQVNEGSRSSLETQKKKKERQSKLMSQAVKAEEEKQEQERKSETPARPRRPANLNFSNNIGASCFETLTEYSEEASSLSGGAMAPPPPPLLPGSFYYLGAPSSEGYQLMSPIPFPPPALPLPKYHGSQGQDSVAYVVEQGYVSLKMSHGIVLDIANDQGLRLNNSRQQTKVAISGGSRQQAAIIHPLGRALLYEPRIEVQVEDSVSVKNAKFYPRGISFTANNHALVYQLDEAGARSTSDSFHDLEATDIVDSLFRERVLGQQSSVATSCQQLHNTRYWRTQNNVDCWALSSTFFIRQTNDGFVILERKEKNGTKTIISASPDNGKLKVFNSSVQLTASRGSEAHFFLRSGAKRLHYNGNTRVFAVRLEGHNAGFEEEGSLKIY